MTHATTEWPALDAHMLRRASVLAMCDPRTIVKFVAGCEPMRPTTRLRITRALRRLGIRPNGDATAP